MGARYCLLGLSVMSAVLLCGAAICRAAAPSDVLRELQRGQDRIIQQQEEQRRQREKGLRRQQDEPPAGFAPMLPESGPLPEGPCVQVEHIEVSGNILLPSPALARIIAPFEGECLSLPRINDLLRQITNAYIERGYVTTRAFAAPEGQEDGVLRILVVEGHVERIILNGGDPDSRFQGLAAFPGLEGKPLNLRDIEQGLDQLNRLPSGNATLELTPGEKLGGTVVRVANRPDRTWRLGAGSNNSGQRSTGQALYNLSFEKDNYLGLGDQLAFYWTADAPFPESETHSTAQQGHNHSFALYFSVPWGYWTFSANMSRFAYDTSIYGLNTEYALTGDTTAVSFQLERVIHRDADSKTSLYVNLNTFDVDAYIEGIHLDTGSYMVATGGAGLTHSRRLWSGVLNAGLGYVRGLPLLGATRQFSRHPDVPRATFNKYTASLSWYRPVEALRQNFYWHLSAYGQTSPQTLYSSERIQAGGRSSVRGFHEDNLSGDTGVYVRNEAGWNIPLPGFLKSDQLRGAQIYTAWDYGWIRPDRYDPYERGVMSGAALGLRTIGNFSLDVAVARPLRHPGFIRARDFETYVSLNVTY